MEPPISSNPPPDQSTTTATPPLQALSAIISNSKKNHDSLSFLDMPENVRKRIYCRAGLVRFCPIDLNRESSRLRKILNTCSCQTWQGRNVFSICWACKLRGLQEVPLSLREEMWDRKYLQMCEYAARRFRGFQPAALQSLEIYCVCPQLPTNLLYVNRSISSEVSRVLYSENKFSIEAKKGCHVNILERLNTNALESLTSLTIRFESQSTLDKQDLSLQKILEDDHPDDKLYTDELIATWCRVGSRLAKFVHRDQLKIFIEVPRHDDFPSEREEFRTTLQKLLPLRQFQANELDLELNAQSGVHSYPDKKIGPFPYVNLPKELQLHILGFTELVAPHDIEFGCHGTSIRTFPNQNLSPFCCRQCTDTLDFCACRGSKSEKSTGCRCWVFPLPIFLVNRQMNQDATEIFYSRNHFIILPCGFWSSLVSGNLLPREPPEHPANELLTFLTMIPRKALKHLRSLQWNARTLKRGLCRDEFDLFESEPPIMDVEISWPEAVEFIKSNLMMDKLSITLDCTAKTEALMIAKESDEFDPELYDDDGRIYDVWFRESDILEATDCMWRIYQRIVEPLSSIGEDRLKSFFIHMGVQSEYMDEEQVRRQELREQILEKEVMGDGYESCAEAKYRLGGSGIHDKEKDYSYEKRDCVLGLTLPTCREKWHENQEIFGPDGVQVWPL